MSIVDDLNFFNERNLILIMEAAAFFHGDIILNSAILLTWSTVTFSKVALLHVGISNSNKILGALRKQK